MGCQERSLPLYTLQGHASWVRAVAFSPDGRILASSGDDQAIKLWETNTGRCLYTLEGHNNRVRSVSFSPDGQTLASGSEDQTIRLWDAASARCLHALSGHTSRVRSISFSPDGHILASGSDDGMIKLWDIAAAALLKTLRSDRPYERMNITGIIGLPEAQKSALKALGAIEDEGFSGLAPINR